MNTTPPIQQIRAQFIGSDPRRTQEIRQHKLGRDCLETPARWTIENLRRDDRSQQVSRIMPSKSADGTYTCLGDIARSEKIGASFASRYHRLVLLAPDIVEAILEGRQPAQLTMKELLEPFPQEWSTQLSLLAPQGNTLSGYDS